MKSWNKERSLRYLSLLQSCLLLLSVGCSAPTSRITAAAPVRAENGTILEPGGEVRAIFEPGEPAVRVRCEYDNGRTLLFFDGEEQLSLKGRQLVMFYDITSDGFVPELVAGKKEGRPDGAADSSGEREWRVTAYRVNDGRAEEISFIPAGEDNSFYIGDWGWLSQGNWTQRVQLGRADGKSGAYQLDPGGYFKRLETRMSAILTDGRLLQLPESQVAVYEDRRLGIAFELTDCAAGTAYYNIYRSTDRGMNWSLAVKDFRTAISESQEIYILDDSTVMCRFSGSGGAGNYSMYGSVDGGVTWKEISELEELKQYWFLGGAETGGEAPVSRFISNKTGSWKDGGFSR